MPDAQAGRSITRHRLFFILLVVLPLALCTYLVLRPGIDLTVSGWFYRPGPHFFLSNQPIFFFLHDVAVTGAWIMGVTFVLSAAWALGRRTTLLGIDGKGWLFLFLTLMLGPVLTTNAILKDHWGRARPVRVQEFGGLSKFTPPAVMVNECDRNCSFVAGDPSVGFFLTSFMYVARRRRAAFWGGIAVGTLFGIMRIAMGSHFFSDVVFAGVITMAIAAGISALMFGRAQLLSAWKQVFFVRSAQD